MCVCVCVCVCVFSLSPFINSVFYWFWTGTDFCWHFSHYNLEIFKKKKKGGGGIEKKKKENNNLSSDLQG